MELLVCLSVYMGITISSRVIRLFIKTSYLIFQTILLRSTSSTGTLHRTELSEQMKASINPAMILFPAIILFWLQIEKVWLSCSLASRGGRPWQYCRQDNLCMAWNTQGNKSRNCSGRLPVLCLFLSDWKNWCRYDHFGILLGFLIVLPQSRTGNIEFSLFSSSSQYQHLCSADYLDALGFPAAGDSRSFLSCHLLSLLWWWLLGSGSIT